MARIEGRPGMLPLEQKVPGDIIDVVNGRFELSDCR